MNSIAPVGRTPVLPPTPTNDNGGIVPPWLQNPPIDEPAGHAQGEENRMEEPAR
jgi:hypothetical protein